MTIFLDRKLQIKLLEQLAEIYPQALPYDKILNKNPSDDGINNTVPNLAYLAEHGLIVVNWTHLMTGEEPVSAKITAKGLDFISDDGGLTARLNVLTVNIHEFTFQQLRDELKKISTSLKNLQR